MSEVFSIRRPLIPLSCIEFLNFVRSSFVFVIYTITRTVEGFSRIVVYEKGLDLLINKN